MNVHLRPTITSEAEEFLEALAEELEIPPYRYEQADTSYKSLGEWLNREDFEHPAIRSAGSHPGIVWARHRDRADQRR